MCEKKNINPKKALDDFFSKWEEEENEEKEAARYFSGECYEDEERYSYEDRNYNRLYHSEEQEETYDDYSNDPNWVKCFSLDHQCNKQVGFLYRPSLTLSDGSFFSLNIFESMSLLVAVLIFVVLGLIIVYGGAIVDAIFRDGGWGGWILTSIMIIGVLVLIYMLLEKILFELFIINLPY